jgi:hypothetical protein
LKDHPAKGAADFVQQLTIFSVVPLALLGDFASRKPEIPIQQLTACYWTTLTFSRHHARLNMKIAVQSLEV